MRTRTGVHNPRPAKPDTGWMVNAACADDPDFTETDFDQKGPEISYAARRCALVCEACPVLDKCRDWALVTRERHGFWGGMTPRERRAWRRYDGPR